MKTQILHKSGSEFFSTAIIFLPKVLRSGDCCVMFNQRCARFNYATFAFPVLVKAAALQRSHCLNYYDSTITRQ